MQPEDHGMDEAITRFRARIAMHVRDGWQVANASEQPLQALRSAISTTLPRAPGRRIAQQAGDTQGYCRRIQADRAGNVKVRNVACPPELTEQQGD